MMVGVLVAFAFLQGFALGCLAYGITYAVFHSHMENRARAQQAALEARAIQNRAKIEAVKDRLKEQYGSDLSKRHEVIVDEEIEKILSSANTRDR